MKLFNVVFLVLRGARGDAVEAQRYKPEGRGFVSFRPHYGPGDDSAFNRNEYREYFLGVKAAGA
jgi:hypothetical protein